MATAWPLVTLIPIAISHTTFLRIQQHIQHTHTRTRCFPYFFFSILKLDKPVLFLIVVQLIWAVHFRFFTPSFPFSPQTHSHTHTHTLSPSPVHWFVVLCASLLRKLIWMVDELPLLISILAILRGSREKLDKVMNQLCTSYINISEVFHSLLSRSLTRPLLLLSLSHFHSHSITFTHVVS